MDRWRPTSIPRGARSPSHVQIRTPTTDKVDLRWKDEIGTGSSPIRPNVHLANLKLAGDDEGGGGRIEEEEVEREKQPAPTKVGEG